MVEACVVIVGGGAAGLSAAGALAHRTIQSVVLEQDAKVGGTWARRYDRLHLHTVRAFSGLAHFPIPQHYPVYLSRDDVVAYLNEYARHFNLRVVTGATVQRVRPNGPSAGGWTIQVNDGELWKARVVVIATGQYHTPMIPSWPGRHSYRGQLTHSASYSNAHAYVGRRVLVVGIGNSGAEIATDLAENGAAVVAISVRTPPAIVPRDPFGMPVQRTSILLSALPTAVADVVGRTTAQLTVGNLARYGLPTGSFAPYSNRRIPLIDVGFVKILKQGRIVVKPAVQRLTETGAAFADGPSEPFDAIIAATGFTTGLETLVDAPDVLDGHFEPRSLSGQPTAQPGLYFIGYTHSVRGHLFEANRASRRLAKHVQGYLSAASGL
jgi:putative flavoprotein involved in K+ transport